MVFKIKKSLELIDCKLVMSLLMIQLVPTLYTTLRVFLLGQFPGEYSFSIAGQLTWVNLFYEIVNESIILPLFYFVGKVVNNKKELSNLFKSGFLVTFCIYFVLAVLMLLFIKPLLTVMSVHKDILLESAIYIRIESIALIFSVLADFVLVLLVSLNKVCYIYRLTGIRLILCIVSDMFMVSSLPCSFKLGVNGIALSNIIVNVTVLSLSLILLYKEKIFVASKQKLSFSWMKELLKIGGISGVESFVLL